MVLSSGFWNKAKLIQIFAILTTVIIFCHGRIITPPRSARLSLDQRMPYYFQNNINGEPGTYSYGYDVVDPMTGNNQFRTEERYSNGTVIGSYGYVDARGKPYRYKYVADERGYRVMRDPTFMPNRHQDLRPSNMNLLPTEPSVTWTRPSRPNKKKNKYSNNYISRPNHNFLGPPSSYIED